MIIFKLGITLYLFSFASKVSGIYIASNGTLWNGAVEPTTVLDIQNSYYIVDPAVDIQEKKNKSAAPTKWDCDFESGDFCNWFSGESWVVQDGRKALVSGLGPSADHTKENAFGRYAYFNPVNKSRSSYKLISETIDAGSTEYCFKFWYYMYSPSPMTLEIFSLKYGQTLGPVWLNRSTSSRMWRYGTYYLEKTVDTSLIFSPNRGDLGVGDIALDDIAVNKGRCPLITPCTENPCKNGGTCADENKTFKCVCPDGYSGKLCEIKDPCANKLIVCLNGGICRSDNESFVCYCKAPYSGKTCEVDPCTNNPCLNGGLCKVEGESFKCDCKSPYSGQTCEEDLCADKICSYETQCEVRDDRAMCNCTDGLVGDTCEVITDCEPGGKYGNCSVTGGYCTYETEKAVCHCREGKEFDVHTGMCRETCDESENFCEFDSPCEIRNGHSFCTCPDGLTGDMCQTITDCQPGANYEKCNEGGGLCNFRLGKSLCYCGEASTYKLRKQFDVRTGKCRLTCGSPRLSDYYNLCEQNTACQSQDKYNFCTCPEGLTGDLCETITDCEPGGKYSKCTRTGGSCGFFSGKSFCDCGASGKFDAKTRECRKLDWTSTSKILFSTSSGYSSETSELTKEIIELSTSSRFPMEESESTVGIMEISTSSRFPMEESESTVGINELSTSSRFSMKESESTIAINEISVSSRFPMEESESTIGIMEKTTSNRFQTETTESINEVQSTSSFEEILSTGISVTSTMHPSTIDPEYSMLWIVGLSLIAISALLLLSLACYCCISRGCREKVMTV